MNSPNRGNRVRNPPNLGTRPPIQSANGRERPAPGGAPLRRTRRLPQVTQQELVPANRDGPGKLPWITRFTYGYLRPPHRQDLCGCDSRMPFRRPDVPGQRRNISWRLSLFRHRAQHHQGRSACCL